MVKHSGRRPRLRVTGGGRGLGSHVGARLLADLADAVGLGAAMSEAMAATRQRRGGRDRGEAPVDAAVMIADGGDTISDIAVLADQPLLFGEVASRPTLWRALGAVDGEALGRVKAARARARARARCASEHRPGAEPDTAEHTSSGQPTPAPNPAHTRAPTRPPTTTHPPPLPTQPPKPPHNSHLNNLGQARKLPALSA